jgi:hypothetical protein
VAAVRAIVVVMPEGERRTIAFVVTEAIAPRERWAGGNASSS